MSEGMRSGEPLVWNGEDITPTGLNNADSRFQVVGGFDGRTQVARVASDDQRTATEIQAAAELKIKAARAKNRQRNRNS